MANKYIIKYTKDFKESYLFEGETYLRCSTISPVISGNLIPFEDIVKEENITEEIDVKKAVQIVKNEEYATLELNEDYFKNVIYITIYKLNENKYGLEFENNKFVYENKKLKKEDFKIDDEEEDNFIIFVNCNLKNLHYYHMQEVGDYKLNNTIYFSKLVGENEKNEILVNENDANLNLSIKALKNYLLFFTSNLDGLEFKLPLHNMLMKNTSGYEQSISADLFNELSVEKQVELGRINLTIIMNKLPGGADAGAGGGFKDSDDAAIKRYLRNKYAKVLSSFNLDTADAIFKYENPFLVRNLKNYLISKTGKTGLSASSKLLYLLKYSYENYPNSADKYLTKKFKDVYKIESLDEFAKAYEFDNKEELKNLQKNYFKDITPSVIQNYTTKSDLETIKEIDLI